MISPLTRIVLVDDHAVFVDSFAKRIDAETDLHIVGTATNTDAGLRLILETKPDLAIFDVESHGRGPFDVAAEIANRQKKTKIVFLSGHLSDVFIEQALRANAVGYLLKKDPIASVVTSIKRIAAGEVCFSETVAKRVEFDPRQRRHTIRSRCSLSSLTSRQLEVLRHLAKGLTVKEVAKRMHLSEKSIDSHKYRIMHKLNVHDRVVLARLAIREGLILP